MKIGTKRGKRRSGILIVMATIATVLCCVNAYYSKSDNLETRLGKQEYVYQEHITVQEVGPYSSSTGGDAGSHRLSIDNTDYTNVFCADMSMTPIFGGDWYTSKYQDMDGVSYIKADSRYNKNQLDWLIDHMWFPSKAGDGYMNQETLNYVVRKYGGQQNPESIVSNVNADDVFAMNQNLIWTITNDDGFGSRFADQYSVNQNLKIITDAYLAGINANSNYVKRRSTASTSVSKGNATLTSFTGVIGPFSITNNGGVYRITVTATADGSSATASLYKDSACTEQIRQYDDYSGNFYVKSDSFKTAKDIKINFSTGYNYVSSGLFWYTTSVNEPNPQPLLTIIKSYASFPVSFDFEKRAPTGSYFMSIAKKSMTEDKYLSGAVFKISERANETTTPRYIGDHVNNYVDESDARISSGTSPVMFVSQTMTDASKADIYTIEEIEAPNGYQISGEGKKLEIKVHKKEIVSSNSYEIDYVEVSGSDAKISTIGGSVLLDDNFNATTDESNYLVKIEINSGANHQPPTITIIWRDEEVVPDGSFKLRIIKQDSNTNQKLSGAEFKVTMVNTTTQETVTDFKGNVLDGTKAFPVDNGILQFTVKDMKAGKYDVTIEESKVPEGYIGLNEKIKFTAEAVLNELTNTYEFNKETPTVKNAKVTINSNLIESIVNNKLKVYSGSVGLFKYEDLNGNGQWDEGEPALQGAKFKIAESEQKALNAEFVKDENGKDLEEISGKDGTAQFTNLDLGTNKEKKYYIVETESPEGYKKTDKVIEVTAKENGYDLTDITSLVKVGNIKKVYDLALRKYITAVKDGSTGEETEINDRIPKVDLKDLKSGKSTTAKYEHTKEPVLVHTTDIVTYTIQIYNEGSEDAYANVVKDDIPEGLEFVAYTEGDGSINDIYRWKLVDENDKEVTDVSKAKYIVTDYLDMDKSETNLIKGYNPESSKELDSRYVKVQFKVTEPTTSDRIVTNKAQIAKETDKDGKIVTDRDSTPNEWKNEDDEDVDHVKVKYFDLALRKWVTEAIVTENGKTVVHQTGHKAEDNPESIVKVDLKKSKVDSVVVKFKYSIRITNEADEENGIAGEATEIRDDIPAGLKFIAEDNPDWREENGQIVTNKLAGTTLEPGESAEVEILLTWINGANNIGVKTNVAEISKDHNKYGTKDIDSTPGNSVPGEDDIDDAPVMLSVKTGSQAYKYIVLALVVITFVGTSATIIKKKVLNVENN